MLLEILFVKIVYGHGLFHLIHFFIFIKKNHNRSAAICFLAMKLWIFNIKFYAQCKSLRLQSCHELHHFYRLFFLLLSCVHIKIVVSNYLLRLIFLFCSQLLDHLWQIILMLSRQNDMSIFVLPSWFFLHNCYLIIITTINQYKTWPRPAQSFYYSLLHSFDDDDDEKRVFRLCFRS